MKRRHGGKCTCSVGGAGHASMEGGMRHASIEEGMGHTSVGGGTRHAGTGGGEGSRDVNVSSSGKGTSLAKGSAIGGTNVRGLSPCGKGPLMPV